MDLQLGLALSSSLAQGFDLNQDCETNKRKRCFDEGFSDVKKDAKSDRILPWLVWDDKRQRDGGSLKRQTDAVVGWPPVNAWRKKLGDLNRCEGGTNYVTVENSSGSGGVYNSMYVKVKMEGVGIARKIDLRIHTCYRTLSAELIAMFGKCEEDGEMYKLTYQDKEGDWLLAGDVPWGSFVQSARRLKLLKNYDN